MHICLMHSSQFIKGTLSTIILKLLDENGRMYGYEITQKVRQLSEETIILTEGALYPTLHKLEAQGAVTTEKVKVGGRTRKYYSLTPQGSVEAVNKVAEFKAFLQSMRLVLNLKFQ